MRRAASPLRPPLQRLVPTGTRLCATTGMAQDTLRMKEWRSGSRCGLHEAASRSGTHGMPAAQENHLSQGLPDCALPALRDG